ncbi:MAG: ORF6N domain-containing protein [Candidatus Omnitrophota bacterium]
MPSKIISTEIVTNKIFFIRGQKVMLDRDLAALYGVPTFRLNEQVKRNKKRFPDDFMFQLTWNESESLKLQEISSELDRNQPRSQSAILKRGKNIKYRTYAFTEQGVAMLSGVLNSDRAITVNVAIMRTFVKLRETLSLHKELAVKLKELESKVEGHDQDIHAVFEVIRRLMKEDENPKKKIGFHTE